MTDPASSDGPTDLRQWIRGQSEEFGVGVDDLLIQSKRRDAMWKGTDADHAKARWFARLWEKAVEGRESDRIHIRGVHYFVYQNMEEDVHPPTECTWSVYRNIMKCYDYLESAAVLARILGYIPLDGIIDQKQKKHIVTEYGKHRRRADTSGVHPPTGVRVPAIPDPEDRAEFRFDTDEETFAEYAADRLADQLVSSLHFDRPSQAPFHVEVWSEKTLPDYLTGTDTSRGLFERLGVNVVVEGEGDLSLTIAAELAERVERAGKPAVIAYLSDYDPKGTEMASNMAAKVAWLKQRGDITQRVCIERLAVTTEQIERLDLPRKPIEESKHTGTGGKSYNTKITEWEERRGVGATELNALENRPKEFKRIVRDGLEPFVDPDVAAKNDDAREEWKDDARDYVLEAIERAGLSEHLEDLGAWIHDFNTEYERAEPMLRSLRESQQEGFYDEWQDLVGEAVDDTTFPVATVPEGEGAYPDDALYDTAREYVENLQRIQAYKNE